MFLYVVSCQFNSILSSFGVRGTSEFGSKRSNLV